LLLAKLHYRPTDGKALTARAPAQFRRLSNRLFDVIEKRLHLFARLSPLRVCIFGALKAIFRALSIISANFTPVAHPIKDGCHPEIKTSLF
jgi:hypothetical protein